MAGNCFFDCGCGEGPPFCPITIHFVDCDGSPIEGAVVTVTQCGGGGLPITPIVGETDSDGNYTLDYGDLSPTEILRYNCYTIAWDGITGGPFFGIDVTLYNCTHAIEHCYRHARVTISTTGAASPGLVLESRVPFTVTGLGTDTIVLTYKSIQYCGLPSPFPVTISMDVGPVDPETLAQYLDNCTTLAVECGDDTSVSLPLFKWDDDYAIHAPACDKGCETYGEGPNFRGITPKVLQCTISRVAGCPIGIYDGSPIEVTWDGVSSWDSGCLPGPGVTCCGTGPYGPSYGSARMQIFYSAGAFLFVFTMYHHGDCTSEGLDGTCPDFRIIGNLPGTVCLPYMYSPVDAFFPSFNGPGFNSYTLHVTE